MAAGVEGKTHQARNGGQRMGPGIGAKLAEGHDQIAAVVFNPLPVVLHCRDELGACHHGVAA